MSVTSRPPAGRPATQRQWVRRGELLDAARLVFERDGYHAATVSAIVQAAGLSQGAFYLYFRDKQAVFAALQEEMATLLRRRIYWASREEADPARRLRSGLLSFFEFYAEYREYNRRLQVEGLGISPAFEARQRDLHDALAEGFRPTFLALGIPKPIPAAFALIGMASQLAYWQHFHVPAALRQTPEQLADACAGLFLHGATSITHKEKAHATGI
ncbi:MAG TPA: TetR/AcrR family transcriptional regulator [Candidatus Limnocylindrales bacterium]|nr:TetR/AcrR family transcriptional regulator [Candidatus Limnocylindrales bacterium]